jgi:hypothetical protein
MLKIFLIIVVFIKVIYSKTKIDLNAIHDVIDNLYTKNNIKFDLIFIDSPTKSIEQLTRSFEGKTSFVKVIKITKLKSIRIYQSAIIFASTLEDWLMFFELNELYSDFSKDFKFLIYLDDANVQETPKIDIQYDLAGHFIYFSYFLINSRNYVLLLSTEWFTENKCDEQQIVIIDRFDKASKTWKNGLEIPSKFHNFHQCPLVFFLVYYGCERHTQLNENSNELSGFLPHIANEVANKGSATGIMQNPNEKTGVSLENFISPSKNLKSHVVIGEKVIKVADNETHISTTYDDASLIFITTPGERYSSYEKLILPFDELTWICSLITFGVAFLVIFIINQLPELVRKTVYGEKVQHATFNVIGAFFGIGQVKLPHGNFPRILLMFFVLFCLVMRTAYQGNFFEVCLQFSGK